MKRKVIDWFIQLAWPVVKFVIINFGQELMTYIFESLRVIVKRKSRSKMEEALKNAKNAEYAAESTRDAKEKMRYYEIANAYKEETDYYKRYLSDFLNDIEETSAQIMETVQQKSAEVKAEDLFIIDKKKGKLKPAENQGLLGSKPESMKE